MPPLFVANEFSGGRARSSVGDEACVEDNTTEQLNLVTPPEPISLVTAVVANTSVTVLKHTYLVPGVVVELKHPSTPANSVMVEVSAVTSVSPTTTQLDILPGYVFGVDFVGADVSIAQNFLRPQVTYGSAAAPLHWSPDYVVGSDTYQNIQVPGARWVGNQWANQKICIGGDFDGAGATEIVGNTVDALIINTGGGLSTTDDVIVAIAKDWDVAAPFASRIPIWELQALGRGVTTLLKPQLDLERIGTPWYGHNHTVGGANLQPISGAWTALDVGLNITTPDLVTLRGKSALLTNGSKTLTLQVQTAMTTNALAGSFLNPNQNQPLLFKIVSNTATTITVDVPMDGVFSAGQVAYVLPPKVAVKYTRVLDRLRAYVEPEVRLHLMFPEV